MSNPTVLTPDLKAQWLEALRSGNYKQGLGQLFHVNTGTYCCLGVLNEVGQLGCNPNFGHIMEGNAYVFHPVLKESTQRQLADFNDKRRWTFAAIADYIEANIPAVEA